MHKCVRRNRRCRCTCACGGNVTYRSYSSVAAGGSGGAAYTRGAHAHGRHGMRHARAGPRRHVYAYGSYPCIWLRLPTVAPSSGAVYCT